MQRAHLCTALAFAALLAPTAASAQNPPVPTGHPRVYVRSADLPAIEAKLTDPAFAEAWQEVDGSTEPLAQAFKYLVQGDTTAGQAAVTNGLAALEACTDARVFDQAMHWGACIYDWCYDLLSAAQRQAFIAEFERIAASHAPGYPADPDGAAVVGHATEGWLLTGQLPAGVAIYDESSTMYDAAATLFMNRFVEVRDYYYPGHLHHQGDSYIGRFAHDQAASWLFRRLGAGDVLSREQQYVPYQILYRLRPDGQQLRVGDTYDDRGKSSAKRLMAMMTGSYYEDPALLWLADSELFWNAPVYHRVLELLFRPAGVAAVAPDGLPRTKYFPMPMGEMVARTGFTLGTDSPDALVQMHVGGTFFGNHQRKDFGTFQIYHRGPLAISSGVYEGDGCNYGCDHWLHYHHQSIAHNGLLIFDPDEEMIHHGSPTANDGGQLWPNGGSDHPADLAALQTDGYELGQVTAWSFGPDPTTPRYSTIAGDITAAYSADKVSHVSRAMVTFATDEPAVPAIVVTFDRIVSTAASFDKTWLLHSIEEPTIDGATASIVRAGPTWDDDGTYDGKLVVHSLLPADAVLTKVGGPGREFWIESTQTNYAVTKDGAAEPGAWRLEISPGTATTDDLFLHVMSVTSNGTSAQPAVALVRDGGLVGAVADGWTVLFSESGELLTGGAMQLQGETSYHVLVCDLTPGWWTVSVDDTVLATEQATDDGRSIYFEGGPGDYRLEPGEPPATGGAGGAGGGAVAGSGGGPGLGAGATDDGGCGCRTPAGAPSHSPWWLVLTALFAVRRRGASRASRRGRRRKRASSAGHPDGLRGQVLSAARTAAPRRVRAVVR